MNKSPIEWTEFSANPIRGECPHKCWYCYADPIRKKQGYGKPLLFPSTLFNIVDRRKPSTIFIGSMIDIFADEIPAKWRGDIYKALCHAPQHTGLLCTKNPKNYFCNPLPQNYWLGITVDFDDKTIAPSLDDISELEHRFYNRLFISFEPLCSEPYGDLPVTCEQIIIGAMTGQKKNIIPKKEWVLKLIEMADERKAKVFLKDNLLAIYPDLPKRRELAWRK